MTDDQRPALDSVRKANARRIAGHLITPQMTSAGVTEVLRSDLDDRSCGEMVNAVFTAMLAAATAAPTQDAPRDGERGTKSGCCGI